MPYANPELRDEEAQDVPARDRCHSGLHHYLRFEQRRRPRTPRGRQPQLPCFIRRVIERAAYIRAAGDRGGRPRALRRLCNHARRCHADMLHARTF